MTLSPLVGVAGELVVAVAATVSVELVVPGLVSVAVVHVVTIAVAVH